MTFEGAQRAERSQSLRVRAATAADIDALVDLVESAYRGDRSREGWTTEADLLDGQRTDRASLSEVLARPRSLIVVGEVGGTLVACAHVEAHNDETCYFGMFAVRPPLQGHGLGGTMLHACEELAVGALRCVRMEMTVIVQRPELIAWYERRGFRATGERRPFPYGDEAFGRPRRADLSFVVLAKAL